MRSNHQRPLTRFFCFFFFFSSLYLLEELACNQVKAPYLTGVGSAISHSFGAGLGMFRGGERGENSGFA